MKYAIIGALVLTAGAALAQGMPSLPAPGAAGQFSNPAQGAPPPPTKKLPNGECVTTTARNYESIRNFVPFVSLEDCLKSGGRPAAAAPAMGTRKPG
jgi:hypothetical protein